METRDLPQDIWEKLEPYLPRKTTGRQYKDLHRTINGIFWILRTGAPWRVNGVGKARESGGN